MTYKTHLAVGYAAVMAAVPPSTFSELIMCIGVTAIGSVISDVDATTSESKKNLVKISGITFSAIAAVLLADYFLGTNIISSFRSNTALMRLITGFLIFLGVCIFGEHQPHRSFMHSIAGIVAVTLSFSLILPSSAKYMAVSMLSHIAIDSLNRKKIQILYPLHRPKIGFGLCYADGLVNKLLFAISGIAAVLLIILNISRYFPDI